MNNIAQAAIVLKLNRLWQPTGVGVVWKSIVDMVSGVAQAIDIEYAMLDGQPDFDNIVGMNAVDWDAWCELPVRSFDLAIHSPHMTVRVPTVLVAREFAEMPIHVFRGRPTKSTVYARDRGIDQYTGQRLREADASVDHVIPKSRGGRDDWENVVITRKQTNWSKGNKMNHEVGLKLLRKPKAPQPMPASALIRQARHPSWLPFLYIK